uniref:FAD dependent oxidoreductase domain-containing protein n=1 Tax=Aureoumbra lagunensis TaxID=44058 RepID=A0A7S3NLB6_9STRA
MKRRVIINRAARLFFQRRLKSSSATAADVCVIGGGIIGVWAACKAAEKGASVILTEQFARCHELGSSHGDGRIWRKAYEEDVYVDMMEQSLVAWNELSKDLLRTTGMLCLEDAEKARASDSMICGLSHLFERRKLAYQIFENGAGVRSQFPKSYGQLPDDIAAIYLEEAGVLFATPALKQTWTLAENLGVQVFEHTPINSITSLTSNGGYRVHASQDFTIDCASIILACGAWLSQIAMRCFDIDIPTRVTAELVSYHKASPALSVDNKMPVFSARLDNGLGPHGYYGIPKIAHGGFKLSAHHAGELLHRTNSSLLQIRHPDQKINDITEIRNQTLSKDAANDILASNQRFLRRIFPNLVQPEPLSTQRCLYTATPDHDYLIGHLLPPVTVSSSVITAGGGSGHAFKNAPAIGDAAACLALGLNPPFDVSQFSPLRNTLITARNKLEVPTALKCK